MYVQGPSGIGKSYFTRITLGIPYAQIFIASHFLTPNCIGKDLLILEDLDGPSLIAASKSAHLPPVTFLKLFGDKYPLEIEIKGGNALI